MEAWILASRAPLRLVNDVKLHYVDSGEGQRVVILIPGWPQTWYAWRKIMPALARSYRVIAIDTRGMGNPSRPESGYDTKTAARDISALMSALGISRYSVVGHDVGMWIAYPLAMEQSHAVEKLIVAEATIPGVTPWPPMLLPPEQNAGMTQFMFNQLQDLPEFLVAGREAAYLHWIIDHLALMPDRVAVDEYICREAGRCTQPEARRSGPTQQRLVATSWISKSRRRIRKIPKAVQPAVSLRLRQQLPHPAR
jgi:pimeloyl-ACP methyl ester carboxylesterase